MIYIPIIAGVLFISVILIILLAENNRKKSRSKNHASQGKTKTDDREDEQVIELHRRTSQETPTIRCPKCGAWYAFDNIDCSRCGYHHEGTLEELMTPIQIERAKKRAKQARSSHEKEDSPIFGYWSCTQCGRGSYFRGKCCPYCGYHAPRQQLVLRECIKCAKRDDVEAYSTYILEVTSQDVEIVSEKKITTSWFKQIGVETEFLCGQCAKDYILWIILKPFLTLITILLWALCIYLIFKVDVPKEHWLPMITLIILYIWFMATLYYLPSILGGILVSIGALVSKRSRQSHVEDLLAEEVAKKYCYNILYGNLDSDIGDKVAVSLGQLVILQKNAIRFHSKKSKRKK